MRNYLKKGCPINGVDSMFVLIGAGGHAKVVVDILKESSKQILGFIDDNIEIREHNGIPSLGDITEIPSILTKYKNLKFIITIGSNEVRQEIYKKLKIFDINYGNAIHPSAIISSNTVIGTGTVVMANAVINSSTIIGGHAIVNTASVIEHDCIVGEFTHISPNSTLTGNVKIGKGTQIGAGATVIPNISIGEWSIIGAGSTVIRNLPSRMIAVGSPAKIIS
ncbi:MAG: acetyltransferase [Bacillota bacterium]|nr:acetyltransferase [Bacillota bacterium]